MNFALLLLSACIGIFNNQCCYEQRTNTIDCIPPPNLHVFPPTEPKGIEVEAITAYLGSNCFNNLTWNSQFLSKLTKLKYIVFDANCLTICLPQPTSSIALRNVCYLRSSTATMQHHSHTTSTTETETSEKTTKEINWTTTVSSETWKYSTTTHSPKSTLTSTVTIASTSTRSPMETSTSTTKHTQATTTLTQATTSLTQGTIPPQDFQEGRIPIWAIIVIIVTAVTITIAISAGGCYVYWQKRRTVSLRHVMQLNPPPFVIDTPETMVFDDETNPVP